MQSVYIAFDRQLTSIIGTMNITFYTAEQSIGVATHVALEESGLEYQLIELDLAAKQQQNADYLQVNPKARVPSLVLEQGILTETPAILTYLAQLAPESPLGLPADPFEHAQIQSFNSYLCSTVHVAHAHKHRGSRWVDDEAAMKAMSDYVATSMAMCFDLIESEMLKGPWVHGSRFSISDPYLYRIACWMERDEVNINNYPKVKAHREAMSERDSVKAVTAFYSNNKR